ncbi:MAG: hypothetical protein MZV64_32215 [Ignavibacteriales bacterium]|nr:hypothetical protein [Ignavibacteriales bacterium]
MLSHHHTRLVCFQQKNIGQTSNLYSYQPGVPMPPKGYTWQTVGFVMGGYHSNARFLDTLGNLIWGDTAQYNIPTQKSGLDMHNLHLVQLLTHMLVTNAIQPDRVKQKHQSLFNSWVLKEVGLKPVLAAKLAMDLQAIILVIQ